MATMTSPAPPVEPPTSNPLGPQPALARPEGGELFRISLEAYRRMGEAGILHRSDRVVLLDGLLVQKMTKGSAHSVGMLRALELVRTRLPAGYHTRPEQPIKLPDGPLGESAPEPDLAVVRGRFDDYEAHHPGPADVLARHRGGRQLARGRSPRAPAIRLGRHPDSLDHQPPRPDSGVLHRAIRSGRRSGVCRESDPNDRRVARPPARRRPRRHRASRGRVVRSRPAGRWSGG